MLKLKIFVIGGALTLASCAGKVHLGGSDQIQVIEATGLPAPAGVDVNSPDRPFRVGAFDELLIDVFGFEEMHDRKIVTDGNGHFTLPIAGEIDANNRTLNEVRSQITEQLRAHYVRNPLVSVNISEVNSRRVTIDGSVTQPGNYPVLGRTTLMQQVAGARGLSEFANQNDVVVFRTVGDQRMVALYNLEAIRRGAYPDPEIFAGDSIVVGESSSRRLFQVFLQASPLLTTPIVALLQRRN